MSSILIINGPNLNLLGSREPEIYGDKTLQDLEQMVKQKAEQLTCNVSFIQTNHEGAIIDALHEARHQYDGVILNPGAYTHYSYAIRDAVAGIAVPVIEVHLSNIHARESFRQRSVIAPEVAGQISGLGMKGYNLALEGLMDMIKK